MNMKYLYKVMLLSIAFFWSCSGSQKEKEEPAPQPEEQDEISVSENTLSMDPDQGSTVSVEITTDGDWTLSGLTEGVRYWLGASAEEGHGNATVTFSCVETNPYDDERIAVLTFKSGEAAAPVVLRQKGDPTRTVSISAESLVFSGPENEELTVDVTTPKAWTLEGYTDEVKNWVEVSPVSGEGNATVTFKALSRNMDLSNRIAELGFRIDRVHCASLEVSQKTGITISASDEALEFPQTGGEGQQLTITSSTDKYPWHVEGYTDAVKAWLSLDTETYTGLTKTVTLSPLSANEDTKPRTAVLDFCISEDVRCSVEITQLGIVLEPFKITWKGTTKYEHVIKGGPDSPHEWFPFVLVANTMGSKPDFLNGKDGEVVATGGSYTNKATWLFKDSVTGEWVPLEMGPTREPTAAIQVYYLNHGDDRLRWRNTYIKIPAKKGYRLTHVYLNSFNSASNATLTLSTDEAATKVVEGHSKVKWGKPDPFDVELTTTQEGVDYYISSVNDRWMDSFEFTYTPVL